MAEDSRAQCPVCSSQKGELLEPPHPARSITSGGIIVDIPLRKVQCLDCGLLRQKAHPESFKTELYRDKYALYHQRPGTVGTEIARYAAMADWICAELGAFDAASLLDVGCGGGMLLEAFRKARPSLHYEGIDPSIENSEKARARGFAVTTGFIPIAKPQRREYDIVLASNVLSHIADPTAFLAAMASMTSESGRVVLYSHDGVEAGADHLWADVEFSFCREHLGALASKAGLELLKSRGVVAPLGQEDKHVLVFRRAASPREVSLLSDSARQELIQSRRHYFDAWRQLAIRLAAHVDRATGPVFNFGASFWSMLLAAYCPDYWRRVDSCIVDLGEGQFLEKPLLPTDQMPTTVRPLIVLGTNPRIQAQLKARLSDRADIVSWEDLIAR